MSVDYSQVTETAGDDISKEQLLRLQTRYYFASQYCKDKDVLEVACGTGPGLGILQKISKKIVAGDYCPSLLLTAFSHYGHRIPFLRFDAHFLPFKNNSFDVIICYEAIYYFKNPDIFVQECNRLLRQKGKLILCTANKDLPDFNPSPHSYFYFSPIEFKELLESQKFQIQCFGDCPVDYKSIKQKALSFVKRMMVKFNLMPKTMAGKKLFKRIVFGKLVSMPHELTWSDNCFLPEKINANTIDKRHKVIFVVAEKI